MAATAIPAMPSSERDYFARVAETIRVVSRKVREAAKNAVTRITQGAKKAGNWALHLAPVDWALNKAKFAGSKVWRWARPGLRWADRSVVRPVAYGAGVVLTYMIGSQLIAALTGLVMLGLVVTVLVKRNRRGKEKVVGIEIAPAPEEPGKPKRSRKKEKAAQVLHELVDVLAEDEEIEVTTTEEPAVVAEPKVATPVVAVVPPVVETPVEAPAETTEHGHGHSYKVRLPEGDLIPTETLEQRYQVLQGLIQVEREKAAPDAEYVCELLGRQRLVWVRMGKSDKIKKDEGPTKVYKPFLDELKLIWSSQHGDIAEQITNREVTGIWPQALHRGAQVEHSRIKKIEKLKAVYDQLKGDEAA